MPLLEAKNLKTSFIIDAGTVHAVRGVSFTVDEGESLGVVGESGCGKSVTMLSVMALMPENARIEADSLTFEGAGLLSKRSSELRALRGGRIGMIFQDPMTSLNPLLTVGEQLIEPLLIHRKLSRRAARQEALRLLELVEIPAAAERLKQHPHELSGGMRQRVMIAMALACSPRLLIADEPTTALDVTIQAQILDLLAKLKEELGMAIVLVTHDLGVVASMTSRVIVMYGGLIMEEGATAELFSAPTHPYTRGLLSSRPQDDAVESAAKEPLRSIPGSPPDLIKPPTGCPFAPRCPEAMRVCVKAPPPFTALSSSHRAACWRLDPRSGLPSDKAPPVGVAQVAQTLGGTNG